MPDTITRSFPETLSARFRAGYEEGRAADSEAVGDISETRDELAKSMSFLRSPGFFRMMRPRHYVKQYEQARDKHVANLTEEIRASKRQDDELSVQERVSQVLVTDAVETERLMFEKHVDPNKRYGRFIGWVKERSPFTKGALSAGSAFGGGLLGVIGNFAVEHRMASRHLATNREDIERVNADDTASMVNYINTNGINSSARLAEIAGYRYDAGVQRDSAEIRKHADPIAIGTLGGVVTGLAVEIGIALAD